MNKNLLIKFGVLFLAIIAVLVLLLPLAAVKGTSGFTFTFCNIMAVIFLSIAAFLSRNRDQFVNSSNGNGNGSGSKQLRADWKERFRLFIMYVAGIGVAAAMSGYLLLFLMAPHSGRLLLGAAIAAFDAFLWVTLMSWVLAGRRIDPFTYWSPFVFYNLGTFIALI
ncbi:MAG TPA: hypothetical protein GXX29_00705 [Firmicutes bacterium]|nr:hypothetical protein [Bacillota bacterium]